MVKTIPHGHEAHPMAMWYTLTDHMAHIKCGMLPALGKYMRWQLVERTGHPLFHHQVQTPPHFRSIIP